MKIDLTTGTWQDNPGCPINITLVSTSDVMGGLKKSRGKIYSLLLGQCTQVLIDKMKQDVDWVTISDLFDPIALFKLIKKFVLKQSDNQYRMAVLIAAVNFTILPR
jgi:hypothetical protein